MSNKLAITVWSFSYRAGAPVLHGPDGGGYIFDCRLLPNPGREEKYAALTGKDPEVISYLSGRPEATTFLDHIIGTLSLSIAAYQARGFSNLFVGFGCTGGQHRSVYCAETTARRLRERFGETIEINIRHFELARKQGLSGQ